MRAPKLVEASTDVAAQARREEILDAAARLFNANGVSQTSLQDLGERLGVTRNALYHYFEDREQLLFEVYCRSCDIMLERLQEAAHGEDSAMRTVQKFVTISLQMAEPEPASLNEHGLLAPDRYQALMAHFDTLVQELTEILRRGTASGELRPFDPETIARSIISTLHWIPLGGRWPIAPASERAEMAAMLCDLLERGWEMHRAQTVSPPPVDLAPLLPPPTGAFDRSSLEDRKRETILSGASRMFNWRGVGATKLDDVAAEFGISKQQLYRYVGNKRDLIVECFDRSSRIYGYIQSAANANGGPANARILAMIRGNAMVQQHDELQPLHFATAVGALSPDDQVIVKARVHERRVESGRLFREGFREKSIRPLDIDMLGRVNPGANTWLVKGFVERDDDKKAEMADTVADFLRLGLLAI